MLSPSTERIMRGAKEKLSRTKNVPKALRDNRPLEPARDPVQGPDTGDLTEEQ